MEKGKETKSSNTILVVIIVILVFIVGFLSGQLFNKKDILKETTKTEEKAKEQSKEENLPKEDEGEKPPKEEEKPSKEDEEKPSKEDNQEEKKPTNKENHHGCGLCSSEGEFCCGTSPDEDTYNYDYLTIDLVELGVDEDNFTSEVFEIFNDNYKYKVKYTKKNNVESVIVNNKTIFERPLVVEKVFILDNGMIGVQYYDKEDQARLKKRDYYSTSLNRIKTIEGISSNVDIFAKEYEYTIMGDCIKNEYKEIKKYKVSIKDKTIDTNYVSTVKEDGCAGMV